ncbi:radical SAM protein [Synergistales bacterium]|nr:radical SAM protein [Synergistales bacterium]
MKAAIKAGYDKKRNILADQIPLTAPYSIALSSSQKCNFRCNYCTQSLSKEEKETRGYGDTLMSWELFLEIVRQLKAFEKPIKRIAFTGLGEPLANPQTPDMVKILHQEKLASVQLDIYTNGYLLDEDMTHRLVDAGLTRLRISLQGLNSEQYRTVAGVSIDFDRLVRQIRYFYEHRKDTILYVKIMDAQLAEGQESEFHAIFGDICDEIFVEHLALAQPAMGDYAGRTDDARTMFGEIAKERAVCHYPFFYMQIDAAGNVYPCPPLGLPMEFSLGNVNKESLRNIWEGETREKLLFDLLEKSHYGVPVCNVCQNYRCFTDDADNLDDRREEITVRLKEKRSHV